MLLYHGTTSARAAAILRDGFALPACFAPDLEGAAHYAACGGEWDLQDREERYHAETGEWPRDVLDPFEMYRSLYPEGERPVVIAVELEPGDMAAFAPDSGAPGGLVTHLSLPALRSLEVIDLDWDPDDAAYPFPNGDAPTRAP